MLVDIIKGLSQQYRIITRNPLIFKQDGSNDVTCKLITIVITPTG
jgi:hypothetical protein